MAAVDRAIGVSNVHIVRIRVPMKLAVIRLAGVVVVGYLQEGAEVVGDLAGGKHAPGREDQRIVLLEIRLGIVALVRIAYFRIAYDGHCREGHRLPLSERVASELEQATVRSQFRKLSARMASLAILPGLAVEG